MKFDVYFSAPNNNNKINTFFISVDIVFNFFFPFCLQDFNYENARKKVENQQTVIMFAMSFWALDVLCEMYIFVE